MEKHVSFVGLFYTNDLRTSQALSVVAIAPESAHILYSIWNHTLQSGGACLAYRLSIFQSPDSILAEVLEDAGGNLDPKTLIRHDARHFVLRNPQDMAVDPANDHLFILDATGPRIVRVEPGADGSSDNAIITAVDLQPAGLTNVRGLAFDPTTDHLHTGPDLTRPGRRVKKPPSISFGICRPMPPV